MENKIEWLDLVDVEVDGGTSCDAFVTSAFHKVWDRELTEEECDEVTAKFRVEIYELEFERKY